jgi:FkbM family methyltransferase
VAVAQGFAPLFDVRVVDWLPASNSVQKDAYTAGFRMLAGACAWVAVFDSDEFLVLDEGLDLKSCLAGRPEAAIAVSWAMFGASGHREKPAGLVIENFLHRAPPDFGPCKHVKSIVRPERVIRGLNPHFFEVDGIYVNMRGAPVVWSSPGLREAPDYTDAKLHHYFTRSWAHWCDKIARGAFGDQIRTEADFHQYDRNEVFDDSAQHHAPHIKALMYRARAQHRKTCAVVLVVRDEADDIAGWLAWYHVLGFDTCIVFDDHSTDGTWEILQEAALHQDVRFARTPGAADINYEIRQIEAYQTALAGYAGSFEWLAFFDADEYLSLFAHASVQDFLAAFPDVDQVLVNWCNYGSSGHYLKPREPAVGAYSWHSHESAGINRHVKAFVRPERVGSTWINVHCFDVAADRSVLASGTPVVWSEQIGIIAEAPDWTVAKLMHFQCRSMEHFIALLKRRPRLQGQPNLWQHYDVADAQDLRPQRLLPRVKAQIAAISGTIAPSHDLIFDIGMSEGNDTAFYLAKGFRVVGVEPDVKVYYALLERFASAIEEGRLFIHNLAAGAVHGAIVPFFHYDKQQGLSGLSNRGVAGGGSSYHVMTIDWPALIARHGVPHYAKIDIEGHEIPFLGSVLNHAPLPTYISVECHAFDPVQALHDLGYRFFKLVDQNGPGGFYVPDPQTEGESIDWPPFKAFSHSSGPFGSELPGEWLDLENFRAAWLAAQPATKHTWFDCHARR